MKPLATQFGVSLKGYVGIGHAPETRARPLDTPSRAPAIRLNVNVPGMAKVCMKMYRMHRHTRTLVCTMTHMNQPTIPTSDLHEAKQGYRPTKLYCNDT